MNRNPWHRRLLLTGVAVMVFGVLDPLEGSIAVVLGAVLTAVAAGLARSPYRRMPYWAAVLVSIGVAALFLLSAAGGFGGESGRSVWWALAILPYPVGWVLAVAGAARCLWRPPATPT